MQQTRSFSCDLLADTVREQLRSYRLTPREQEIVGLLLRGMSNKAIAHASSISEQTVKDHLKHVYRKMGVGRRTALIVTLLRFPPTVVGKPPAQDRADEVRAGAHRSRRWDNEAAD